MDFVVAIVPLTTPSSGAAMMRALVREQMPHIQIESMPVTIGFDTIVERLLGGRPGCLTWGYRTTLTDADLVLLRVVWVEYITGLHRFTFEGNAKEFYALGKGHASESWNMRKERLDTWLPRIRELEAELRG
jgi:hypothetical protein